MTVIRAERKDAERLGALAVKMWDDSTARELAEEFEDLLKDSQCAVFLLMDGEIPAGFAQCQLRHDYVEGTDGGPVGYLEGIFVEEAYRNRGGAKKLLESCENWARESGCREFASDCELDNKASLEFHLKTGFCEANRIICFVKRL